MAPRRRLGRNLHSYPLKTMLFLSELNEKDTPMIARALLLSGALMMTGTAVQAYPGQPPFFAPNAANKPTAEQIRYNYRNKLVALREEAIAIRDQDGGTLTDAHRAELQDRLDRIHADLRQEISDGDVFSVSADGRRRR